MVHYGNRNGKIELSVRVRQAQDVRDDDRMGLMLAGYAD